MSWQFNKVTVKTSLGNEIDITPSANHRTVSKKPSMYGEPNSSVDVLNSKGELATRRYYDENGRVYRDVDMTNHGNPKVHPEYPHEHYWKFDKNGNLISR